MAALPVEILFASTNAGKIAELREIAAGQPVSIIDPKDLISRCGAVPCVDECADSYRGNALKKAQAFFLWSGMPTLADDAGLEVDALNGDPGVRSARFAGETASMADNKALLLKKLAPVSDERSRTARFRSILCLMGMATEPLWGEGVLEGSIAFKESGGAGFGYDTLFVVRGCRKTLAELKETDTVETHRAKAFKALCRECGQLS